jgi:hypothetical protein
MLYKPSLLAAPDLGPALVDCCEATQQGLAGAQVCSARGQDEEPRHTDDEQQHGLEDHSPGVIAK